MYAKTLETTVLTPAQIEHEIAFKVQTVKINWYFSQKLFIAYHFKILLPNNAK